MRMPATLTLPIGCAVGFAIVLFSITAFFMGNAYTLKLLTSPYIKSSALVQGFFAQLSEGRLNAVKDRYIDAHLTVGGLTYEAPTGWLIFGKPAKLTGHMTNQGDRVLEAVTLSVYFVDGTGRIAEGGDFLVRQLIKPGETVPFELSAKEAGFDFPKSPDSYHKVFRIIDVQFYEPPPA